MFQQDIRTQKEKFYIWNFELSIVADWSWSMEWQNNVQQKIACLLIFEALKLLHDKLEMDKMNLAEPINFLTEWFLFYWQWVSQIKEKSTDFTDKDRLTAYRTLDFSDWKITNDYDWLNVIIKSISEQPQEYLDWLKNWKIKKIVIVLSDGGSSNELAMMQRINYLRSLWIIVYWIWITNEWRPVVELFTWSDKKLWKWLVCENPTLLAKTLKDLLLPHLEVI